MINRKKIRLTYPYTGAEGQYSWWANDFVGVKSGAQMYSLVREHTGNEVYIEDHPYNGGVSWLWRSSQLRILGTNVKNRGVNYSTKRSGQCVYMVHNAFDSDIAAAGNGNAIRDALGDGNISSAAHCSGPYILAREYEGHVGKGNNLGSIPDNLGWLTDFPAIPYSSDPAGWHEGETWLMDYSLPRWYDNPDGSAFTIVVRMTGNADDWGGQDYRNRSYRKYSVPKDILTDLFVQSTYYENDYDGGAYENICWNMQVGESLNGHVCTYRAGDNGAFYQDDYGVGDEPSWRDVSACAYDNHALMIKVTPPQWLWNDIPAYTPTHNDPNPTSGELGWKWVVEGDEDEMLTLNPYQRIDYVGLDTNVGGYCTMINDETLTSETCYSDESCSAFNLGATCVEVKRQFSKSDVMDFRPVTFITSNFRNDGQQELTDPDLQAITLSGEEYALTTAPLTINFGIRLAENKPAFTPEWLGYAGDDPLDEEHLANHSKITDDQVRSFGGTKFMMYVVDWETDKIPNAEDDATAIESWEDYSNVSPNNWQELAALRNRSNTFVYTNLWDADNPNEDGSYNYNTLTHQYNEPGIKYITAVLYTYINHSQPGSIDGIPYKDHIQALRWKLIKAKIYIGLDNAYVEDFVDIVGKDYKLLPFPYTVPVVGGLSKRSQYVKSLSKVTDENLFEEDDILERNRMELAQANSPLGDKDELGSHLGKADIAQVRYMEGPDPGTCAQGSVKQVGIEMVDMSGASCRRDEFCGGGEYGGFECEGENCGKCIGAETYDMNNLLMLGDMWTCPVTYEVAREFVKNSKLTSDKFNYSDIKESYTTEVKCNEFCNYFSISCLPVYPTEFHNFNDWNYWYSYPDEEKNLPDQQNMPRYTRDSCVGKLFINDTSNVTLKKKVTIEMNMGNKEHQMFHKDPKGAKGILLGDFMVSKSDVNEKILRENLMEEPKTKKSKKAF
tara:strand:+ start:2779 stop:5640 length:2862 start_codon:yes stop_codon:yes gene_type:complete